VSTGTFIPMSVPSENVSSSSTALSPIRLGKHAQFCTYYYFVFFLLICVLQLFHCNIECSTFNGNYS
jgi:hypothetical protein